MFDDHTTLKEARDFLRENWTKGEQCPCCAQFVKMYKRALSAHMVVCLIGLLKVTRENTGEWFHVDEFLPKGQNSAGDYAFMRYWNLIEKKETDPGKDKKSAGLWKITGLGINFLGKKTEVPAYIKTYNAKFYGFDGSMVNVVDCLKNKFSYSEMMKGFSC